MQNTNNSLDKLGKFFKAYDVRGTVPEIDSKLFYWIGYGLVKFLQQENLPTSVNLAHDTRYSSPEFYAAMHQGIIDAGGQARALGIASSDFLYAACQVFGGSGAIVTASHNPKDDNGVKIVKHGSTMLGLSEGLGWVKEFVKQNFDKEIDLENQKEPATDESSKNQVIEYFKEKIEEIGKVTEVNGILKQQNKRLKIAVDTGNGMGGFVMNIVKEMYSQIDFVEMYWDLDGTFPNHPADPQNFANLKDLQAEVQKPDVDFGFAFDGDADRVFFVDDKSEVIQGDFLVAFFAKSLLADHQKTPLIGLTGSVVYIQPGSRCVPETIAQSDGVAIPSKQGHTGIKLKMNEFKAIYGGEFSGHHYFGNFGFMDSGLLAAVLMIKILVKENAKLSDIFRSLRQSYFISDLESIRIPEGQTFEDFKEKLLKAFPDGQASFFDGLSIYYPDWKFSMRSSNTEPVVRFILETRFIDKVKEKLELVKQIIL